MHRESRTLPGMCGVGVLRWKNAQPGQVKAAKNYEKQELRLNRRDMTFLFNKC